MAIRVMLVDDQVLLRTGFRMVLAAQPDMEVVAEAGDGAEAIEILRSTAVDVVLMDVRMPRLDGVEATRRICAQPDAPKVLILTTFDLDEYAFSGLKAGASGFMLKDVPPAELLAAIRSVHSGDAVVAPSTTRRLLDRFSPMLPSGNSEPQHKGIGKLTEREREVMLLVAQGLSNGEIAARLVLSEATVKTHVGRILTKLSLRDRVQVVVLAYETGLVRAAAAGWADPWARCSGRTGCGVPGRGSSTSASTEPATTQRRMPSRKSLPSRATKVRSSWCSTYRPRRRVVTRPAFFSTARCRETSGAVMPCVSASSPVVCADRARWRHRRIRIGWASASMRSWSSSTEAGEGSSGWCTG